MPVFISEWRKHKGLTLQQLAERLGIQETSMSRMERGQQSITVENLEQIAPALGCEVADLFRKP